MKLVSNDNELYASFYDLVGMGARRAEDTTLELQRLLADDILFPQYRNEITRFGDCSLTLKEASIDERTTVFEENSLYFCIRHNLGIRRPAVPMGFRATWSRRDELAAAKLEPGLQASTKPEEFARVLTRLGGTSEDDQFIEVHIYGPLHRSSIAHAAIAKPKQKADKAIVRQLEASLRSVGATIEIYG
ncbi:MAG: hypothetical protein ACRD8O_04770 [Bryobacteraceae bacterium]